MSNYGTKGQAVTVIGGQAMAYEVSVFDTVAGGKIYH